MKNNKILLVIGTTVIVLLLISNYLRKPVHTRHNDIVKQKIQLSFDAASAKNKDALSLCQIEVNSIVNRYFPEINRKAKIASEELSSYKSCIKLIGLMAVDKVKRTDRTSEYLNEHIHANLEPTMHQVVGELQGALARFENTLCENTTYQAYEMLQLNPDALHKGQNITIAPDHRPELQPALRNLGLNGTIIGAVLPLDIMLVLKSGIGKSLTTKALAIAGRSFGKHAAKAATSTAIAAIDGPVPIGDVIAVVGLLWTAHDLSKTRKTFESELETTIQNSLPTIRGDVEKQVVNQLSELLKAHQQLQHEIRQHSIETLTL